MKARYFNFISHNVAKLAKAEIPFHIYVDDPLESQWFPASDDPNLIQLQHDLKEAKVSGVRVNHQVCPLSPCTNDI